MDPRAWPLKAHLGLSNKGLLYSLLVFYSLLGLFKEIPTLTKPVWSHHPTPLKALLKVSDTVVGGRSSMLTSNRCNHRHRDVHTEEDRTDPSMVYIYVNMYKKSEEEASAKKKKKKKKRPSVHPWTGLSLSKKKKLNSYPWIYKPNVLIKKKFWIEKKEVNVYQVIVWDSWVVLSK